MSRFLRTAAVLLALEAGLTVAAPTARATGPTVKLDNGTFVGTTSGSVSKFLGIPFAQSPTGDLRFRLPKTIDPYTGTQTVSAFGPACPQQEITLPINNALAQDAIDFIVNELYSVVSPSSEDCLTLNVVKPASATASSKLPVVVWIFGGGFEIGGTSIYDGGSIVQKSIDLGEPVVYVSMNYRVSAFGFLASEEVKNAGIGNLGLQDQREALRWIQKYIGAFGGDPTKVTIWGESAGAISVALHMITNGGDTEGLFRGAFMQSGSPIPVGDISNGQKYYDALVDETGCSGTADTLQCLRAAPYGTLKSAVDKSPMIFAYQSLNLAWLPRVDGTFLTDTPFNLVQQGSVANIPFITGDCDDEGTLFSLSNTNVTTDADVKDYISSIYLSTASSADVDHLLDLYTDDITKGSPYSTGILNAITPQFKRLAALQGDVVFQAPRRFFLKNRADKQNAWSFLSKRLKLLPVLGSVHASDLLNVYGSGDMVDYLVRFAATLDPNGNTGINWPQYTTASPQLLTFQDGLIPLTITQDTYRQAGMEFLMQLSLVNPL
ncbi:Esterase/lipase/thioesterase [Heterobasidion irregulare TC 32-1]|uniref:Carboxylic ester hydrolase n=1 Tax=Heterobasidion irregulare (strain TC 32-1) TaxID=747525 RepID=W4JZ43_HETIT|nr:Esterase/lipase/thioesterase [Heterobasidion irregulare TC 32-1]ETW78802.1 Esterase/lipase/thioesterase [Heterobasidion irregulare TC 32-1]